MVSLLEKDQDYSLKSIWEAFERSRLMRVETTSKDALEVQIIALVSNGEIIFTFQKTGAGVGSPIYLNQWYDPSTAYNYLNARYQSPNVGRFVSEDPAYITLKGNSPSGLSDPQRFNSYSYARNNPITIVDPSGLWYYFAGTGVTVFLWDVNIGVEFNNTGLDITAAEGPALGAEYAINAGFSSGDMPNQIEANVNSTVEGAVGAGFQYTNSGELDRNNGTNNLLGDGQDPSNSYGVYAGLGGSISHTISGTIPVRIPGSTKNLFVGNSNYSQMSRFSGTNYVQLNSPAPTHYTSSNNAVKGTSGYGAQNTYSYSYTQSLQIQILQLQIEVLQLELASLQHK